MSLAHFIQYLEVHGIAIKLLDKYTEILIWECFISNDMHDKKIYI